MCKKEKCPEYVPSVTLEEFWAANRQKYRKMAGTDDYYVFMAIKQAVEDAWNFQERKEIVLDEILNRLPKVAE